MSESEEQLETIQVVRILNPFDVSQRMTDTMPYERDRSYASYVENAYDYDGEIVGSLNGKIIDKEEWPLTYLAAGDSIVLCPVPHGKGGKSILRIVAMIALAVVVNVMSFGTLSPLTVGLIKAGIMVAGGMLVNALLPVKPAGNITSPEDLSDHSPSYGIDGAKNTSVEGVPVPVIYGSFRTAGNLVSGYVENVSKTQYLYLLYAVSEGLIHHIDQIEINDQPISNYTDVLYEARGGSSDQGPLNWFNDTIVPVSKNIELTNGTWITHTTTGEVDRIRVDLVAPGGLQEVSTEDGSN
jgi:predicted phage tail protein